MLTEDQFIQYYEKLARAHTTIAHDPAGVKSFFEIEDPDELGNFDKALRGKVGSTVLFIFAGDGEIDDHDSNNHVQTIVCYLYIMQKKTDTISSANIRSNCITIVNDLLARTKTDIRAGFIVPGRPVTFRIDGIPVGQVGPISLQWYGYAVKVTFSCPFAARSESGTWTDIP